MGEHPWPPATSDAEALATALCDVFGSAYFEPFLALAQEPTPGGRTRLLRRAGAPVDVAERQVRLAGTAKETETERLHDIEPIRSAAHVGDEDDELERKRATEESHQVRRTRLFEPADLLVDGEAVIVQGMEHGPLPAQNAKHYQSRTPASNGTGYGGYTDLEALNELGMIIALAFEINRLRKSGLPDAAVFNSSNPLPQPEVLIFDVSTPERIALARAGSPIADEALKSIAAQSDVSPRVAGLRHSLPRPTFPLIVRSLDRVEVIWCPVALPGTELKRMESRIFGLFSGELLSVLGGQPACGFERSDSFRANIAQPSTSAGC